jgi:hypothetical protein
MTDDTNPRISFTGETADRMHDLLNKFSGLYDRDANSNKPQFRNAEAVASIVSEVARLLNVSPDDATAILTCQSGHAMTDGDPNTFSYDPSTLPSANPAQP